METSAEAKPVAVLVEADLFFAARIKSVLSNIGYQVTHTMTVSPDLAAFSGSQLVLVNMACRGVETLPLVRALRTQPNPPKIVGYMSHVRIPEIRDEAIAAGLDRLIPNSAATQRLPQVLEHLMRGIGPAVLEEEDNE